MANLAKVIDGTVAAAKRGRLTGMKPEAFQPPRRFFARHYSRQAHVESFLR